MKILVLGAGGRTGRHVVAEAMKAGHEVIAMVRRAESGASLPTPYLIGDAMSPMSVIAGLKGCNGVIDTIGLRRPVFFSEVNLFSKSTSVVIDAMRSAGVQRLITMTGVGAGDSKGHLGFFMDHFIFPLVGARIYNDKDRQEALIRKSDLAWTIVRPGFLNDQPGGGPVVATTDLSNVRGGKIARQDVAKFLVAQLTTDRWLKQAPSVFYG